MPRIHRPPQPLRPVDPGRTATRAQGAPGRDDRGRWRRRQRLRPIPPARGPRGVRAAERRAGWPARDRVRLGIGRQLPRPVRPRRRGERRVCGRQLCPADRRARLGGPARRRVRAGPDARNPARGDGGGRVWAQLRPRLPARVVCLDRRAGLTHRRGREARRLLPHPCALYARRSVPRPIPRGDRDRQAGWLAGAYHALLPSVWLSRRS